MRQHKEDTVRQKIENYKVRVTTRIQGAVKNRFFMDVIKRGTNESDVAKEIITLHYSIMSVLPPTFNGREFSEIKDYVLKKLV